MQYLTLIPDSTEKSIQSTQSVQLDSDALDFNTVLMMGDKIGALSERGIFIFMHIFVK